MRKIVKKLFFIFFVIQYAASLFSSVPWDICLNNKISSIEFYSENGSLNRETLKKILSTKNGDKFSILKIDRDLKNLLSLDIFSEVKVSTQKEKNGCKVIFSFKINQPINGIKIIFKNGKFSETLKKDIERKIKAELLDQPYNEKKIKKLVNKIKKEIENNGLLINKINFSLFKENKKNILIFFISLKGSLVLKEIIFKGVSDREKIELEKKVDLKKGKIFKKEELRKAQKKAVSYLKNKGFFMCSVKTQIIKKDEDITIIFNIKKKKRIILNIIGARIKKTIFYPLWENVVFPPWAIEEGKNKILFELRKKGFFYPKVEIKKEESKEFLKIIYIVNKGKRYRLGKISFKGNVNFSSKKLHRIISKYIKEFFYYGYFDASVIKDIIYELQLFYWNNGFKKTKITYLPSSSMNKINLTIIIKEGEQTVVKEVSFKGVNFFNVLYLREKAGIKGPLPYNNRDIQRWKEIILSEYYKRGFDDVFIDTIIKKVKGDIFLTFDIEEGKRYTVEDILWIGDRNINESLFWKSIKLKKGDYLDRRKLQLSLNTLESLGVFKKIEIKTLNKTNNKKIIIVKTYPEKSDYLSYGLGWGERVGLKGMFEYQRYNIFGKANSYSFVMKYGKNEKRIILSFDTPWKTSLLLKSFFSSWFEEESLRSYSYRRLGLTMNLIKKLEAKSFFTLNFSIVNTKLLSLNISPSEIDRENAPFSTTSIAFSFTRDRRDDPFNPTKGNFYSMNLSYAFPFLGTASKYIKLSGKFQKLWLLKNDIVILDNIRLGAGWGNIPIVERFFAGGSSSFRGEAIDELGPKDPETGAPLGGKAEILNNFEIIIPSPLPIEDLKVAFFYDKGNIMSETIDILKKSFDDAVGIGLRYKTPLGPLRIDFGWNLEKKARRKFHVYFAIGNIF